MTGAVLSSAAAVFAALLFARAALLKFADPAGFRSALAGYRILPDLLIAPAARALPVAEAATAALLLAPAARGMAASAGAALLAMFAVAVTVNLARGRTEIDCGCGGARQTIGAGMALRNLAVAAALVAVALAGRPGLDASGVALAAAAGATGFLLHLCGETFHALSLRPRRRLDPGMRRLAWARPDESRA